MDPTRNDPIPPSARSQRERIVVHEHTRDLSDLDATRPRSTVPPPAEASKTAFRQTASFQPRRKRWPGLLAAGLVGAGVAALVVSNVYDERTVGQRLDAGVQAIDRGVDRGVAATAQNVREAVDRTLPPPPADGTPTAQSSGTGSPAPEAAASR